MLGNTKVHNYSGLKRKMENMILDRFPETAKHIQAINIDKSSEVPISASLRSAGIFMNVGAKKCEKEAVGKDSIPAIREEIPDSLKAYIDKSMDSLVKGGMSEADAKKKVQDSLEPCFGYDKATGQYVVSARAPSRIAGANKDSLLEQTSIPMWNIGWLNRIIKQPFATSHAKNLVSVESFSNPWADVIGLFKESFEGYGKLSSVARGNMKQNNSNPITNEASQIVDEVFNLSVDYESDTMEDIKARQSGNFITGQIKADREKYANMVLDRMQDALIYFGSDEAGINGLMNVATVEQYAGTPLHSIFTGTSETKGADIVEAMNTVIGNFLRENHYMARKVVVNVSEYVFQALTQTMTSKVYNPQSPLKTLQGNFMAQTELGLKQVSYTIVADTMLNPSITGGEQNPFNTSGNDLMFITTPTIEDALSGTQDSLIIHPELLKSYVVPALWQRSGLLYTMYKRIGGIIAPVEGTVHCVEGFGYQS
nr:MAG TPA: major capsid protein [Caudoviricetes sp.]